MSQIIWVARIGSVFIDVATKREGRDHEHWFHRHQISDFLTTVMILMSVSSGAQAAIAPHVGPWEISADRCSNFASPSTWRADCIHLDGGTWAGSANASDPFRCENPAHPRPWPNELEMEDYVANRAGANAVSFDGWLADDESTFCLGFFDTGTFTRRYGVEQKNFGLFTVDGDYGTWGARRDREVKCQSRATSLGHLCDRGDTPDPYKGAKYCPNNGTNPVSTFTGEKIHSETDYRGSGPDPLIFARHYASDTAFHSGLWERSGFGTFWRHTYSRSIAYFDSGTDVRATLYLENGDRYHYEQVDYGDGPVWVAVDPDVVGQLSLSAPGPSQTWRYINDAGVHEHYDFNTGRLLALRNRDGFESTLSYDAKGRLIEVENAFGRALKFSYYDEGIARDLIAQVTVAQGGEPIPGLQFRYRYIDTDTSKRTLAMLEKVFYPDDTPADLSDDPFKQYLYAEPEHLYRDSGADVEAGPSTSSFDKPQALTGIIDENGQRFATYKYKEYNFSGYRIDLAAWGGHGSPNEEGIYANQYTLTRYHPNGFRRDYRTHQGYTSIKDAHGVVRDHHFEYHFGVLRPTSVSGGKCRSCDEFAETTYDPATGFELSQTDHEGNKRVFEHNEFGLEVCRIEGVSTVDPSKNAPRRIVSEWNSDFRVKTRELIFTVDKAPVLDACDATDDTGWKLLRESVNEYVAGTARLASHLLRDHSPSAAPDRLTQFSYYESGATDGLAGQLKSINGPRGDVDDISTFKYAVTESPDHNPGDLIETTNALGQRTTIIRHDEQGRPLQVKDANGTRTYFRYDARGRLTRSSIYNFRTSYAYDDVGNLTRLTLPDGSFTKFIYDDAHRLTALEDALGNTIEYTLDPMGNRIAEEVYDSNGNLVTTLARVYDVLDRLEQTIDSANGAATTMSYDDNNMLRTTTNRRGFTSSNHYDALSRVMGVIDAYSNATKYEYDALDNVVAVTDPRANTTQYRYNAFGDLTELISPDTGHSIFSYDEAGNRIVSTDARGVQILYEYDALNRLSLIDYPQDIDTEFIYDTNKATSHLTRGRGRIGRMIDESGITDYRYEAHGNVKEAMSTIEDVDYVIWYAYDKAGHLESLVYPSGRRVDYERDAAGNVISINQTVAGETTTLLSAAEHFPFAGTRNRSYAEFFDESLQVSSKINDIRIVDSMGRMTDSRVELKTSVIPQTSVIDMRRYVYDPNGNVERIDHLASLRPSDSYIYDSLDRLSSWTRQNDYLRVQFNYDANGNRVAKTTETTLGELSTVDHVFEPNSNRFATASDYDLSGNELMFGAREFGDNNRLKRVLDAHQNERASYTYNGLGRRVTKTVTGDTTVFHYDQQGRLIAETDIAGESIAEYIYLNDEPFAIVVGGDLSVAQAPSFVAPSSNGLSWRRWNNAQASGHQSLLAPAERNANKLNGSRADYSVAVANPGRYTLYVRGKGNDWDADRTFVSTTGTRRAKVVRFVSSRWDFVWRKPTSTVVGEGQTHVDITLIRMQRDVEVDVFVLSLNDQLSSSDLDDIVGLNGGRVALADTYVIEAEGTDTWTAEEGDAYFYQNDHLGTPQSLVDQTGNEVWRAEYKPFGAATVMNETITNNLRFPGQYYDTETDLHYNMFRDYDPETGRYVESDPIGLTGGLNTYTYALNNPVVFTDPTGELVPIIAAAIAIRVVGGALAGATAEVLFQAGIQYVEGGEIRPECLDLPDIAIAAGFAAVGAPGFQTLRHVPRLAKRIHRNPVRNRRTKELTGDVIFGALGAETALFGAQRMAPFQPISNQCGCGR